MFNIVTVTYNDADHLKITLDSIRKFKTHNQKYFVIDGLSTDNTLSLIRDNNDIIDSYIVEADKGIYDAMNKVEALPINDNDYILWLNAGDELLPWGFLDFSNVCADVIFAGVIKKSQREVFQKGITCLPEIYTPYNEKNFYPKTKYQHQGFLIKKSCFLKYKYDVKIGLQAENLLMSRCILFEDCQTVMSPVSIYYTDGVSNTKTKKVLSSYLKVADALGFSKFKVLWFQKMFFAKAIIYALLPGFIKKGYESKKYNNE